MTFFNSILAILKNLIGYAYWFINWLIENVNTFWSEIGLSSLWSWLPSDIQNVMNLIISLFTVLAMVKLFKTVFEWVVHLVNSLLRLGI